MKHLLILATFAVVVFANAVRLEAQDSEASEQAVNKSCESSNKHIGKNSWREVALPHFTLCIPKEFVDEKPECIDGGCSRFSTNGALLAIDSSDASWRPTTKHYRNYSESFETVDGKSVWIWSFERSDRFKWNFGLKIKWKKTDSYENGIGIYFFSNRDDAKDIATTIFKSIKFRKVS